MRVRESSRLTACKSNLKNISTVIETYANNWKGMYPGGKAGQPITELPDVGKSTGSLGELANTYIQKNTICPTNKGEYYYGQVRSIRY